MRQRSEVTAGGPSSTELLLKEVIEEFDTLDDEGACLLGRGTCDDQNPCAAHTRWKDVSTTLARFFEETTVADLVTPPVGDAA